MKENKQFLQKRSLNEMMNEGELLIVPKGTEHRPVAEEEFSVMLFEPCDTLNTGNTEGELTKNVLEEL